MWDEYCIEKIPRVPSCLVRTGASDASKVRACALDSQTLVAESCQSQERHLGMRSQD